MYLRVVRAAGAKGVKHEYVRVVEAYRENGKNKHRTIINLGRKDLLAAHLDLDKLNRLLHGEVQSSENLRSEKIQALDAWDWGPMLVARSLWTELGLTRVLEQLGGRGRDDGVALSERAFVLVANRLVAPGSEHGLARWLETDFVCDQQGRRWLPAWRDDAARKASKAPRVRVEPRQLQQWYRTLDQLLERKPKIEHELYLRLRDLATFQVDVVFYDLTSTYFEGKGPTVLGAHGYSRDCRPRDPQVLVGLVLIDGWPIAHHVFPGNWRDANTVPAVLCDLDERFGLKRIVFVGDRGMVTARNLDNLRARGHGYIVGRNRRRSGVIYDYIQRATGEWLECPVGITASERKNPPKTLVQEVPSGQDGVRVFVVHSDERLAFERAQRIKSMERVRIKLAALERRVAEGRLKSAEKIGAAAAAILARNHGHRYYGWRLENGVFQFFEHPVHFAREQAYEGKYIIQTEEKNLSPLEAVRIYKELSEVERAMANIKDVIEMRPIYHRDANRVRAHIFIAVLAFVLHRAIEKKLKAAKLDLSATEALTALKTVRVVDIDLGNGTRKRCVTRGSQRAAQILHALGVTEFDPPTPQTQSETRM
jgi:transposase